MNLCSLNKVSYITTYKVVHDHECYGIECNSSYKSRNLNSANYSQKPIKHTYNRHCIVCALCDDELVTILIQLTIDNNNVMIFDIHMTNSGVIEIVMQ